MKKVLFLCTTDSMIWNFLIPHIKDLQSKNITVECACSKTGFYFEELEQKHELTVYEIPFHRSPYNISNMRCLWQLIKLIKKNKYEVIHCHEPVGGAMGRIAGWLGKCKVIYTAHGFHFFYGNKWFNNLIYRYIEKFFARMTDVMIVINKEDYKAAKTFKLKKGGKLYIIDGIGCNIKKIHDLTINKERKRKELGIPKDSFVVITTAELIARKNIDTGIKSFIEADLNNSFYLICGDGKEKNKLKHMIEGRSDIKFLGFRKDIDELNAIADVCLFPSKQEGLSIAVIEAVAAGLMMVVSNARGVKDCVVNGESGIVCKNNVKEYAEALRIMHSKTTKEVTDYYLFNKNYSNKYDINVIIRKMNEIYLEL